MIKNYLFTLTLVLQGVLLIVGGFACDLTGEAQTTAIPIQFLGVLVLGFAFAVWLIEHAMADSEASASASATKSLGIMNRAEGSAQALGIMNRAESA